MDEMFTSFEKVRKEKTTNPVFQNSENQNSEVQCSAGQSFENQNVAGYDITGQNIMGQNVTVQTAGNGYAGPQGFAQQNFVQPNFAQNSYYSQSVQYQTAGSQVQNSLYDGSYKPVKPKHFDIKKKDIVFTILFCVATSAFSVFGLWGGFRGGFTISALLIFLLSTIYLDGKKTKVKLFPLICGILSCTIAVPFIITSNGSVRFWSFVVGLLLSAVWFESLVNDSPAEGDLGLIKRIFLSFGKGIFKNMPRSVASLFNPDAGRRKWVGPMFIGILSAIPVLFVVIPLLMASDAAFNGFVLKITENVMYTIFKVVVGILIAPFIISYCFTLKKEDKEEPEESGFEGIENVIVISFLSVLSLCYIAYLVSQLSYFFSAFSGFLPEDYSFTLAGYARRGFFEMAIIAGINFAIIFAALIVSKKKDKKICIASRILCLFIGFFTLVIISTALSKMFLYIENFGMTRLRITTSAFMIFIVVIFISLLIRLFVPRIKVFNTALVTAGLILSLLGILNVNTIVAKYNYNAYKDGSLYDIDVSTIYELGDEGIPYLVKLADDKDGVVAGEARKCLREAIEDVYYDFGYEDDEYVIVGKCYDDIGEYSVSLSAAYDAMDDFIERNPEYTHYDYSFSFFD